MEYPRHQPDDDWTKVCRHPKDDALSSPMRRRYLQTLFLEKSWKKQILN